MKRYLLCISIVMALGTVAYADGYDINTKLFPTPTSDGNIDIEDTPADITANDYLVLYRTLTGNAELVAANSVYGFGASKAGEFTTLTSTGQASMTVSDTTTTSTTYANVASPLYVANAWAPAGGSSSAVRFGIAGIVNHAATGDITGTGHYGGVLGYGYTNFSGLTDAFVIGVEGRCGAVLGDATVCAANVATFDKNDENAGSIGIGVGYYIPDQDDDGHIGTKFSFFSDDAAWTMRNDGNIQGGGDITSTDTGSIGWSIVTGANTACNTTCTNACVYGWETSAGEVAVACTDATADKCLCAGAN